MLRAEPDVFGLVASDPMVSRLIDTLAASGNRALSAVRQAHGHVREHVWQLAGDASTDADGQVTVDLDGLPAGPWVSVEAPCCAAVLPSGLPSDGYAREGGGVGYGLCPAQVGVEHGQGAVRGPGNSGRLWTCPEFERVAPWPCPTRAPARGCG
ncbi:hypothetical protein Slala05_63480 [Streptomyces lavendulae subsp. lavendulae]|nr:hypothetical protein Slala05_63480 [Streptomyces lavendulae subsp. lavendulae]